MENSHISWTDHTFNPWEGCTKISPACDNCYAWTRNRRFHAGKNWGVHAPRLRRSDDYWDKPLLWEANSVASGKRTRVFCASLADVFDHEGPAAERRRLWNLIRQTPHLDWQILTKRPQNFRRFLPNDWGRGYANVWLGCSTENVGEFNRRTNILRAVPAAVRFLSCEPLLEDLGEIDLTGIHWVIVGGESGPGARSMAMEWAANILRRCKAAGVKAFVKQLGVNPTHQGGPFVIMDHDVPDRTAKTDPTRWPKRLRVQQFPTATMQQSTDATRSIADHEPHSQPLVIFEIDLDVAAYKNWLRHLSKGDHVTVCASHTHARKTVPVMLAEKHAVQLEDGDWYCTDGEKFGRAFYAGSGKYPSTGQDGLARAAELIARAGGAARWFTYIAGPASEVHHAG